MSVIGDEKKEDRRVRRTKRLLTQALTELMQQKKVTEITVKQLTDLADMNRGTFYLYYRDILDMLQQLEDSLFDRLNAILTLNEQADAAERTMSTLLDLFVFVRDNQEICRAFLSPNGDMSFLHRLNRVMRDKFLHFYLSREPRVTEGEFDYRYSFVVFGCAGIIRAWADRNCLESPEYMAEVTGHLILEGGKL